MLTAFSWDRDALGALNLIAPFILVANSLMALLNIGGATILAVCIGKVDRDGANTVFRHGMLVLLGLAVFITAAGVFFTEPICVWSGAGETHLRMAVAYLFIYSLFFIPSGLSMGLQSYCRNDGAPGLVGITVFITTFCNIFNLRDNCTDHRGCTSESIGTKRNRIPIMCVHHTVSETNTGITEYIKQNSSLQPLIYSL